MIFAKVFTGFGFAPVGDEEPNFQFGTPNGFEPMWMFEEEHEPGEKVLLNGTVLAAGQTGLEDVGGAVDNLFYHANTGPFIGRLLIQRLVKSNPCSDSTQEKL